jgi:hypothetical protein
LNQASLTCRRGDKTMVADSSSLPLPLLAAGSYSHQ